MPWPAALMPFRMSPEPSTGVPMAACVFFAPGAVRISCVTGFIALSVLPVQVTAPLLQPGT